MIEAFLRTLFGAGWKNGSVRSRCGLPVLAVMAAVLCVVTAPRPAFAQNYQIDTILNPLDMVWSDDWMNEISGIDVDVAHRIHVFERSRNRMRVFSDVGQHLFDRPTFGGLPAVLPDGTMVVADNVGKTLRAYDYGGSLRWSTPFPDPKGEVEKLGVSGAGTLVAAVSIQTSGQPAPVVWHIGASGPMLNSWSRPQWSSIIPVSNRLTVLVVERGPNPRLVHETALDGTIVGTFDYDSPGGNGGKLVDAVDDGSGGLWVLDSVGYLIRLNGQGDEIGRINSYGIQTWHGLPDRIQGPRTIRRIDNNLLVSDYGRIAFLNQDGSYVDTLLNLKGRSEWRVGVFLGRDDRFYLSGPMMDQSFNTSQLQVSRLEGNLSSSYQWNTMNENGMGMFPISISVSRPGDLALSSVIPDNFGGFKAHAYRLGSDGWIKSFLPEIDPVYRSAIWGMQYDDSENLYLVDFVVTPQSNGPIDGQMRLSKVDPLNNIVWQRPGWWDLAFGYLGYLNGFQTRPDGSSVLRSTSHSYGGSSTWIIDTDGNTKSAWQSPFEGGLFSIDRNGDIVYLSANSMVKFDDQGYLVADVPIDLSSIDWEIVTFAIGRDGTILAGGIGDGLIRLVPEWTETTPPTSLATVDPAAPATGWHLGPVDVVFTSADDRHGSGLKQFVLDVDGRVDILPDPLPSTVARTFTTAGDHVIRYHGVDHAGNQEATQTLHVKVDLAIPQVQANVTNRLLTLTATDDASGVEWIRYRVDNGPELTYTGPVSLPLAAKVVRYQARDFAGRLSAQQSRVVGQFLKRVVFTPTSATAGASVVVKVELLAAAPAGGIELNLVSTKPDVLGVPSTVTILAGASSASFTRTLGPVSSDTSVQTTASFANTSTTGGLVVRQSSPKSVAVAPSTLFGGESAVGSVVLAAKAPVGGHVVQLESLDPAVLTVPATLTVPAGALSAAFAVGSQLVESDTAVLVVAKIGSRSALTTITVRRNGPVSLTVTPSAVTGGTPVTGRLTLARPAPAGGLTVVLASTDSEVAVPASVVVPSGSRTATFPITTSPVVQDSAAAVRAERAGLVVDATLTVLAARLTSVTVAPNRLTGGGSATGTVTLTGPAPAGGLTVDLSVSNPAAGVPSIVTVPAGARTATFLVSTSAVPSDTLVTIAAVSNLDTKETVVTVRR